MPNITTSNFLLLDTETTGISPENDRIIEVGWMIVSGSGETIKPCTSHLCTSEKAIPPEASAVHHITDVMLEGAKSPTEVMNLLEEDCLNLSVKAIVCHNLNFDGPMLATAITNQPTLQGLDGVCTLRLARRLFPDAPSHSLQVLRYALGIDCPEMEGLIPHRAKADVIVLQYFFKFCLEAANLPDYDDFIQFADEMFSIKKMMFGKYKGQDIKDLPTNYIEWLLRLPELDADLNYTLRTQLGLPT